MRLHDFLEYWARVQPDAEFALLGRRRLTYDEALAAANRVANALIDAGLRIGDRAAVLSKNSLEYLLVYFGASKAGVVLVPLNYRLAPPEWTYILNDAGPQVLLVSGLYTAAVDEVRPALETVERFVALGGAATVGWEAFESWVAGDRPATPPERFIPDDADVYQMYTSGTTGHPKGAMITQRALAANIAQNGLLLEGGPGERGLVVAPLFHAASVPSAFTWVSRGGSLYLMEDFDPVDVVRALSEERIVYAVLVPAMIQACLVGAPDVADRRYDALRLIYYGASPIAEQTLRRAMAVFGCDFLQAYGLTEATQILSFLSPVDHRRGLAGHAGLLVSSGRPVIGTEIRIVDGLDRVLPSGTLGEIVARGPQLMRGYWNQPDDSARTLRDGWLHTGDIGCLDNEGYLYIQDRSKDMIVSGGENVYPRVVEDVLFRHPAVADAAVIGVPDDRWGETVKAIVVVRDGMAATGEEIIEFCRGRLGGFERPRSVDFIDALPRNPSGKVLKRVLRAPHWAGQPRGVAGA